MSAPAVDTRRAVQPIAAAPSVPVRLAIDPDEQLTTEWLRQLIAGRARGGRPVTRLLVLNGPMVILPGESGLGVNIHGRLHANDECVLWTRRKWGAYRASMRQKRPEALANVRIIEVAIERPK